MEVKLCDFCKEIIHGKYYFLAIGEYDIRKIQEQRRIASIDDFFRELNRYDSEVNKHEICEECFKLYKHFLNMRIDELNKIKKQVNDLLEFESHKKKKRGKNEK